MSSRKTCQKAQPSVEENGLLNGYDDDDDCTILKFSHLHQEQHQNPGRRFVRSKGSLSPPPPGSLLATDCSKVVVLV